MLPLVLTEENTVCILSLPVPPSQVHSVALLERASEVAVAWKRNVCSVSASEVSVAQFKTAVFSGKEITVGL